MTARQPRFIVTGIDENGDEIGIETDDIERARAAVLDFMKNLLADVRFNERGVEPPR